MQETIPHLAVIVVGDDKETLIYVGLKDKAVSFIGGTLPGILSCLIHPGGVIDTDSTVGN